MNWLILRTDTRKEQYVTRQVQNLGFDAWLPAQIIVGRPTIARRVTAKAHLQTVREIPLLPRRVFVSADFWLQEDWRSVRHVTGFEHDAQGRGVQIPACQVAAFRAEIDRENTAALALAQKASRKQKAKWRSLHDALLDLIEQAKTAYEVAA